MDGFDRNNGPLNKYIENVIEQWDGTIYGQCIKNMYENGTDYQSICEYMNVEYEEWEDCT